MDEDINLGPGTTNYASMDAGFLADTDAMQKLGWNVLYDSTAKKAE